MDLPYISLYFSGMLSMQMRGAYDKTMIGVIRRNLIALDNYSKNLILSNYYLYFVFYFQVGKRQ